MTFTWHDYDPKSMMYIEHWIDEATVSFTGLDDGFRAFYEYWVNEDGFVFGENFWCKAVFDHDGPFAVVAFCWHEQKAIIMEVVVAPEKRGQGAGSKLLKALIKSEEIIGFPIDRWEAVIYPSNIASQKAFENAGFRYRCDREDEAGESRLYVYG